ncbi:MAG: GntR family transcriptional regulator [Phycisphaerales bacterium]|nr:GntR family transcriptional regulator [Phycisphaerales bacterium]
MALKQKELAYAHVRQKLLLGDLPMGGRLREDKLAKEIGVSRTPVREALNQLDAEGLIDLVRNRGAFVQTLTYRDVKELYSLRALLEGYAAQEAAQRATPEQLDQLFGYCQRLHEMCLQLRESDWVEFPEDLQKQWTLTDVAFHLLILHISGSPRASKIVADMRILTQLCGRLWIAPQTYRRYWHYMTWGDHLRIVRAIARRDGQTACLVMKKHITAARDGVLKHFPRDLNQPLRELPQSVRETITQMEQFTGSRRRPAGKRSAANRATSNRDAQQASS